MKLTFTLLSFPLVMQIDESLETFDFLEMLEILGGLLVGGELVRADSQFLLEELLVADHVFVLGMEEQVGGATHSGVVQIVHWQM